MKNTITTFTLAIVLMFGTTLANAGIIVGGRGEQACSKAKQERLAPGIIVGGRTTLGAFVALLEGIIVGGRDGIIVGGRQSEANCAEKSGILVSDKSGILVSDRTGILVSD